MLVPFSSAQICTIMPSFVINLWIRGLLPNQEAHSPVIPFVLILPQTSLEQTPETKQMITERAINNQKHPINRIPHIPHPFYLLTQFIR